jgi:hypothetical protein
MDPSGTKDRMSWKGYHDMYLRKQDLETANDDIRAFIKSRCPKLGNQQSINGSYLIALTIFF